MRRSIQQGRPCSLVTCFHTLNSENIHAASLLGTNTLLVALQGIGQPPSWNIGDERRQQFNDQSSPWLL